MKRTKLVEDAMHSASKRITPQGIVIYEGVTLFAGVLPYVMAEVDSDPSNPGEIVGVASLPEDLFAEESLCSLIGVGVYIGHPENMTSDLSGAVGMVISAEPESGYCEENGSFNSYVEIKLAIWDQAGIDHINAGNKELSCGYVATFVKESGIWGGSPYWYKKTNIQYNHIALLPPDTARNGSFSRISDAKSQSISLASDLCIVDSRTYLKDSLFDMEKFKLADGKEILLPSIPSESKSAILDLVKDFADLKTQIQDAKSALNDKETEIATLKKEALKPEDITKQVKRGATIALKAEKLGIPIDYNNFDPDSVIRQTLKEKGYQVDDGIEIQVLEYAFNHLPAPEQSQSSQETTDSKPTPVSPLKKALDTSKPETNLEDFTADSLAQATFNQRKKSKSS